MTRVWHVSPGADLWVYLFPADHSHFSLGALVALNAESPVETYTLGYTFVWGGEEEVPAS